MRGLIISFILMPVFSIVLNGQINSLSDQYLNNMMAVNPAFAGSHDALSATISYRNQWIGFRDAPENLDIAIHTPIANDRVGVGLLLTRSSYGVNEITELSGNYAFRAELSHGTLALGLGFGATMLSTDWNKLSATDPDDDLISGNDHFALLPDFSFGVYYYNKKMFAGLSLPRFMSHSPNTSTGRYRIFNDFAAYNYLLTAGYCIDITKDISFMPSTMIRLKKNIAPHADINAQFALRDLLWIGGGYRTSNVVTGFVQCQLNYQLKAAYSYDFETGPLNRYSKGSHEILFCYVFRYMRQVNGPRNF